MIHRYVLTAFFSLTTFFISAQIEMSSVVESLGRESDIYDLEVRNPSGSPYIIALEVELRQDNQLVYQAVTNQYSLISPVARLSQAQLEPIQVGRNSIQSWSGSFQMDIRAIDIATGQVLYADRMMFTGLILNDESEDKKKKGIDFQYSGEANIYGQLSSMQGVGSQVPQNFVRAEIHPDVQISGIPIGVDILLSTEQNALRQSMNQIALRFDAQQFKQTMQRHLQAKIKEIDAIGDLADVQNLSELKDKAVANKFPKLKEWEAQLNDPQVQEGLQQIKQLESIEQVIQNPEIKEALKNKAILKSKAILSDDEKEELERLIQFAKEIEKLRKKAEELRSLAKQFEQYRELGDKISQAKKFANRDLIKDPAFIKEGVKKLNLLSKPQEILNGFDAITIGTSFPFYSRQTLSSLSVNGITLEWNPGEIYVASTYGQSSRQTFNSNLLDQPLTLPQTTLAVKAGYGSPQNTHFHITYMDIKDRFIAEFQDNENKPQSNRILGTSAQMSLWANRIMLGGELNASVFTRDHTIKTEDLQEFRRNAIPLHSVFGNINNSSSFDIAWRVFTDLKLPGSNTNLKASAERVGANYHSLGAPVLLNDMLRWKTELRQSFLKNKVSISAFVRQDANNLDPLLTSVAMLTRSFGISGAAHFSKLPSLTFSFAPFSQNSTITSTDEEFNTKATMLNVALGYPYKINSSLTAYTQLSFLSQDLTSNISEIDYDLIMYGVNQSITYKRNSLNVSLNYTPNQVINNQNQEVWTLNSSATTLLFEKLHATLGLQYLSISQQESRTGFFTDIKYPITTFADFKVRVQRNIYQTQKETDNFKDIVAWMGLSVRW